MLLRIHRRDIVQIIGKSLLHPPLHRARHVARNRELHAHTKGDGNADGTGLAKHLFIPFRAGVGRAFSGVITQIDQGAVHIGKGRVLEHRNAAENVGRHVLFRVAGVIFKEVELGHKAEIIDDGGKVQFALRTPFAYLIVGLHIDATVVEAERPAIVVIETDETAILQLRLGERHHGIEVAHVITHAHMRPHFKGFGVFKLGIGLTKNSQATQNQ